MPLNLEIDNTILTNQPTDVVVVEPEARTQRMANGGYTAAARAKGTKLKVIWGVDVSPTVVMAELRTARGSSIAHQLEWDDVTGTHQTIQVLWPRDPNYAINPAFSYKSITVEFLEEA